MLVPPSMVQTTAHESQGACKKEEGRNTIPEWPMWNLKLVNCNPDTDEMYHNFHTAFITFHLKAIWEKTITCKMLLWPSRPVHPVQAGLTAGSYKLSLLAMSCCTWACWPYHISATTSYVSAKTHPAISLMHSSCLLQAKEWTTPSNRLIIH